MGRRRRRNASRVVLLVALLVWFGVRSSSGPAPQRGPSSPLTLTNEPVVVPRSSSLGTTANTEPRVDVELASSATSTEPAPSPIDMRAPTRDRFRGCMRAMASNDLAAALSARRDVRSLELNESERAELARTEAHLGAALTASVAASIARAQQGEVVAAARELRALMAIDLDAIEPRFATATARSSPRELAPLSDHQLPRGTRVRWLDARGVEQRGEVAMCGTVDVSVRVRAVRGFLTPTMARSELELIDADHDLARRQQSAMSAVNDDLLARLWAVRVASLGD